MIDKRATLTPALELEAKSYATILFALLKREGGRIVLRPDEAPRGSFRIAFRQLPNGSAEVSIELETS